MGTPEQEFNAALLELETAVQQQVKFWERPMGAIGQDQAAAIQRRLESARAVLRALFAERIAMRVVAPKDLGIALPQSAVLEAGRPKPIKVDP